MSRRALHDFQCTKCDAIFEARAHWKAERAKCKCGGEAERVWLSRSRRGLSRPIVLFRHLDGTYEYPGDASKRTPRGAERIEIRTMAEYTRVMAKINDHECRKWQDSEDRRQQGREAVLAPGRADILHQLSRETDPHARAILNEAVKSLDNDKDPRRYSSLFNEAMEMNAANRDRDREGRK